MTKKRKNSRSPTISPTYISTSSKAVPSPLTTNQEHNLFDSPNRISEFLQYEPVQFDSPKLLERQHSITSTRRSSTFSPRISLWQDSIINNSNVDTSLLNLDSPKEKVKTVPPSPIQEKKEPELKNTTSIKAAVKPTVNNGNNSQSGWKCQMCSCPEHQTPLKRKGPDGKRVCLINYLTLTYCHSTNITNKYLEHLQYLLFSITRSGRKI